MNISTPRFGTSISFNLLPKEVNDAVIEVIADRVRDRSSSTKTSGVTVKNADGSDRFVVGPEAQVVAAIKGSPLSVILAITQRGISRQQALGAINRGVSDMLGKNVQLFPVREDIP
jgi:hypothetical protein